MKKLFIWVAAAAVMAMSACSGDSSKKAESESTEVDQNEVVETEVVEPESTEVDAVAPEEATPAEEAAAEEPAVKDDYIKALRKSDPSVKITPSGLAYKVITPGKGAKPNPNSNVSVKYVGKHIDGSEFDNSRGNAIEFNLGGVIPGFSEGIGLMNRGAKYVLYIPGELAYGERGVPQAGIQPNELLIFEVELVDFN